MLPYLIAGAIGGVLGALDKKKKYAHGGVTEEEFRRYVNVQKGGYYNMLTEAGMAMEDAGLDRDTYFAIINNYNELSQKYPHIKPFAQGGRTMREPWSVSKMGSHFYVMSGDNIYPRRWKTKSGAERFARKFNTKSGM